MLLTVLKYLPCCDDCPRCALLRDKQQELILVHTENEVCVIATYGFAVQLGMDRKAATAGAARHVDSHDVLSICKGGQKAMVEQQSSNQHS